PEPGRTARWVGTAGTAAEARAEWGSGRRTAEAGSPPHAIAPVVRRLRSGAELGLDLGDGRVRQCRAVGEDERGDGLVAAVGLLDDLRGVRVLLDVDLGEVDALALELALEPVAVATPRGGVQDERCVGHRSLSLDGRVYSGQQRAASGTFPRAIVGVG